MSEEVGNFIEVKVIGNLTHLLIDANQRIRGLERHSYALSPYGKEEYHINMGKQKQIFMLW